MSSTPPAVRSPRSRGTEAVVNVFKGGLIGMVETMPGVSGGTVALVVLVYERLIEVVYSAVTGLALILSAPMRGRENARRGLQRILGIDWWLVVPLGIGMVTGLLTMASIMETLIVEHPVLTRAAFFGMVAVSLLIPIRLAGRWRPVDALVFAVSAAAVAFLVSLPSQQLPVTPLLIIICAAIAVCALVLPGLSGSFILLSLGMYQPALSALNDRDLVFIGWFFIGALLGGATAVLGLRWLLHRYHHITMVVITGLMAGGLRALWPWQDEERHFTAIDSGTLWPSIGLALGGAILVYGALLLETRSAQRTAAAGASGSE